MATTVPQQIPDPKPSPMVLFVDDETQILSAFKRAFRGAGFCLHTANSGAEALELVVQHNYAVIVSDMRMPGMNGAEFLTAAAVFKPSSKRLLLTGYSDNGATITLINKSKIHAYLEKPIDTDLLRQKIEWLIKVKNREDAEYAKQQKLLAHNKALEDTLETLSKCKKEAEQTLDNTVAFLGDAEETVQHNFQTMLKVLSCIADKRLSTASTQYIRQDVEALAISLSLDKARIIQLDNAVLVRNLGKISFPDNILRKQCAELPRPEEPFYQEQLENLEEILFPFSGMAEIVRIIRLSVHNFNSQFSSPLKQNPLPSAEIPVASRILKVVFDFHRLLEIRFGCNAEQANIDQTLKYMLSKSSVEYDPFLLERFMVLKTNLQAPLKTIEAYPVSQLAPSMVIARDLLSPDGILLFPQGHTLTRADIDKLLLYSESRGRVLPMRVAVLPVGCDSALDEA